MGNIVRSSSGLIVPYLDGTNYTGWTTGGTAVATIESGKIRLGPDAHLIKNFTFSNHDYVTLKYKRYGTNGYGALRFRVTPDSNTHYYGWFLLYDTTYRHDLNHDGADVFWSASGSYDTTEHSYAMKWNGSTFTFWQDEAQVLSGTQSTHSSTEQLLIYCANVASTYIELDDLSLMSSWNITCSGLPTGWKFRVRNSGATVQGTATESGGTATVDMSGKCLFPYYDVQVLNASDEVQATLVQSGGVFGGDSYTYSPTTTGQIDAYVIDTQDLNFINISTWGNSSNSLTATVYPPTGTSSGDLMLLAIGRSNEEDPTTVPTGWTLEARRPSGQTYNYWVYSKVAGASEPTGYTWNWTTNYVRAFSVCALYRGGFDSANPVGNVSNTEYIASDTNSIAESFNISSSGNHVVDFVLTQAGRTFTAPTGVGTWSERQNGTIQYFSAWVGDVVSSGGYTGSITTILSTLTTTSKHSIALEINKQPLPVTTGSVTKDIDSYLIGPIINVKTDYSAVGNGSTDDTVSLNNAMNACPDDGTVFFPTGTYLTSAVVDVAGPYTVSGESATASVIYRPNVGGEITILRSENYDDVVIANLGLQSNNASTGNLNAFYVSDSTGMVIRDLWIDGVGYGIRINDNEGPNQNVTVSGVTIESAFQPMYWSNTTGGSLYDCVFNGVTGSVEVLPHGLYLADNLHNIDIDNLEIHLGDKYAIHMWHGTGGAISNDISFTNIRLIDTSHGISVGEGFTNVVFDGVTGTTERWSNASLDIGWINTTAGDLEWGPSGNFIVKNFDFTNGSLLSCSSLKSGGTISDVTLSGGVVRHMDYYYGNGVVNPGSFTNLSLVDIDYVYPSPLSEEVGSAANWSSTASTGITIDASNVPIQLGDVIVALITSNGTPTISDTNGANSFVQEVQATQETSKYAIYRRVAGSSEPTGYSWSLSASNQWSAQLRVFRGIDTNNIWDIHPSGASVSSGTSITATAPSATTNYNDSVGITVFVTDAPTTTKYKPHSVSNGYDNPVQVQGSLQSTFVKKMGTSGAVGATTLSLSGSNDWRGFQIFLKVSDVQVNEATHSLDAYAYTDSPLDIVLVQSGTVDKRDGINISMDGSSPLSLSPLNSVKTIHFRSPYSYESSEAVTFTVPTGILISLDNSSWDVEKTTSGIIVDTNTPFYIKQTNSAEVATGSSLQVDVVSWTYKDRIDPIGPTVVSGSAQNASALLYYSGATDNIAVTNYDEYHTTHGGSIPIPLTTPTNSNIGNSTYTVTGLTNGVAYDFWVRAKDAANNKGNWVDAISNSGSGITPVLEETEIYTTNLYNDANLVAYYRLESNGTDNSSTNNALTARNSATYSSSGKFGYSSSLSNSDSTTAGSGKCFTASNVAAISPGTGNFSISMWFKSPSDSRTASTEHYLICKYGNGGNNMYMVRLTSTNGYLVGYYRDNEGDAVTVTASGQSYYDNNWHHVAWIRNATSGSMYVDGSLINTNTNASLGNINTNDSGCILCVGGYSSSTSYPYEAQCLNGQIDDLAIFNKALSQEEITFIATGE